MIKKGDLVYLTDATINKLYRESSKTIIKRNINVNIGVVVNVIGDFYSIEFMDSTYKYVALRSEFLTRNEVRKRKINTIYDEL